MEEGVRMAEMEARGRGAMGGWSDVPWWVFLITGLAWLLIAVIVLRFDVTSVATVGFLIGALFVFGCINEFIAAQMAEAWKWLHWVMAIIFLLGAVWSFVHPYNTFFALASVLGLILVFMGTLEIIKATMTRGVNPLWGLGLFTGILMLLLGIWVSQQFYPARADLILLWVGFMSLFRGIGQIVLAFGVRRDEHAMMA
jgi:uncharacterized membrane protein HdeD (DUF308 family)